MDCGLDRTPKTDAVLCIGHCSLGTVGPGHCLLSVLIVQLREQEGPSAFVSYFMAPRLLSHTRAVSKYINAHIWVMRGQGTHTQGPKNGVL